MKPFFVLLLPLVPVGCGEDPPAGEMRPGDTDRRIEP